jgi:glycosyltransferase involved in cell wall biosynthesis
MRTFMQQDASKVVEEKPNDQPSTQAPNAALHGPDNLQDSRRQRTSEEQEIELTILMPCLNEAETIETCVRKAMSFLAESGVRGEVLVCDNGSTDGSQAMAERLGARVIDVPIRGYGAALIAGIEATSSRFIIMGDADDSYDFTALAPFVSELRAGADLVMGNRFKGGIKPGAMPPLHRYLGNPVLSWVGRVFFANSVGDFHCGLRGFSREAMLNLGLNSTGMEFASEMVVKSALVGLRITEVPTTLSPDGRSRPPHLRTWRDGWRHLRFLLLYCPRWLFLYPGLLFIAAGIAAIGSLIWGPIHLAPNVTIDIHSLVVACFATIVGSQLVMFSALARKYGMIEGFLPRAKKFNKTLWGLTLERFVLFSALLFVLGVIGTLYAVYRWALDGFGPITYNTIMRTLVISLTAITISVQTIASAFLSSLFEIRHRRPNDPSNH